MGFDYRAYAKKKRAEQKAKRQTKRIGEYVRTSRGYVREEEARARGIHPEQEAVKKEEPKTIAQKFTTKEKDVYIVTKGGRITKRDPEGKVVYRVEPGQKGYDPKREEVISAAEKEERRRERVRRYIAATEKTRKQQKIRARESRRRAAEAAFRKTGTTDIVGLQKEYQRGLRLTAYQEALEKQERQSKAARAAALLRKYGDKTTREIKGKDEFKALYDRGIRARAKAYEQKLLYKLERQPQVVRVVGKGGIGAVREFIGLGEAAVKAAPAAATFGLVDLRKREPIRKQYKTFRRAVKAAPRTILKPAKEFYKKEGLLYATAPAIFIGKGLKREPVQVALVQTAITAGVFYGGAKLVSKIAGLKLVGTQQQFYGYKTTRIPAATKLKVLQERGLYKTGEIVRLTPRPTVGLTRIMGAGRKIRLVTVSKTQYGYVTRGTTTTISRITPSGRYTGKVIKGTKLVRTFTRRRPPSPLYKPLERIPKISGRGKIVQPEYTQVTKFGGGKFGYVSAKKGITIKGFGRYGSTRELTALTRQKARFTYASPEGVTITPIQTKYQFVRGRGKYLPRTIQQVGRREYVEFKPSKFEVTDIERPYEYSKFVIQRKGFTIPKVKLKVRKPFKAESTDIKFRITQAEPAKLRFEKLKPQTLKSTLVTRKEVVQQIPIRETTPTIKTQFYLPPIEKPSVAGKSLAAGLVGARVRPVVRAAPKARIAAVPQYRFVQPSRQAQTPVLRQRPITQQKPVAISKPIAISTPKIGTKVSQITEIAPQPLTTPPITGGGGATTGLKLPAFKPLGGYLLAQRPRARKKKKRKRREDLIGFRYTPTAAATYLGIRGRPRTPAFKTGLTVRPLSRIKI